MSKKNIFVFLTFSDFVFGFVRFIFLYCVFKDFSIYKMENLFEFFGFLIYIKKNISLLMKIKRTEAYTFLFLEDRGLK